MNVVWVLVCDSSRGRLFEIRDQSPTWIAIDAFDHVESRTKTSDLLSDRLGQRSSEGASVHHGALAPSSSPRDVEEGHFGLSLASMLDETLRAKRFAWWVLVAPPHFLGALKKMLTPAVTKQLLTAVGKDLTHLGVQDLGERLRDVVRVPANRRETVREPHRSHH
jgi:protein required for attachment to host cells